MIKNNVWKDVGIVHHENGDSDFTFQVKMNVGAEDKYGSTVTIGKLQYTICKYDEKYIIEQDYSGNQVYGSPEFNSKSDAIEWLINRLKGT